MRPLTTVCLGWEKVHSFGCCLTPSFWAQLLITPVEATYRKNYETPGCIVHVRFLVASVGLILLHVTHNHISNSIAVWLEIDSF